MKKDTLKAMRRNAREQIPVGSIRVKVVPMKKKAILDRLSRQEAKNF